MTEPFRDFRVSEVNEAFDLLYTPRRLDVWGTCPHGATLLLANLAAGLIGERFGDDEAALTAWIETRRRRVLAAVEARRALGGRES